ncbi:MAG: tyrosine-type recombinase/integrase [Caulobacterales bacterium]
MFRPFKGTSLSARQVRNSRLAWRGNQCGARRACHLFGHTMAPLRLENCADIRCIQAMLGHAELSTTEIYTQVSIKALKAIHSAAHPARAPEAGAAPDQARGAASALLERLDQEGAAEG